MGAMGWATCDRAQTFRAVDRNEGVEEEVGGSWEKTLKSLPGVLVWVTSQSRKGQEGASEERARGESSGASWTDNHNLHRPTTKCVVVRLACLLVSRVSSQEEEMVQSSGEKG